MDKNNLFGEAESSQNEHELELYENVSVPSITRPRLEPSRARRKPVPTPRRSLQASSGDRKLDDQAAVDDAEDDYLLAAAATANVDSHTDVDADVVFDATDAVATGSADYETSKSSESKASDQKGFHSIEENGFEICKSSDDSGFVGSREITKLGMLRYLDSDRWSLIQETLQGKYDVIYQVVSTDVESEGEEEKEEEQEKEEIQPKVQAPGKPKVKSDIRRGRLSDAMADVYVNFVPRYGDFSAGGWSAKDIAERGGPQIEQDYRGIRDTQPTDIIVVTDGGKLRCKKVYHVVCPVWDGSQGQAAERLRTVFNACLARAHKDCFRFIAVPYSGMGVDTYPLEVIGQVFAEELTKFNEQISYSTLSEVSIVVSEERQDVVDIFEKIFQGSTEGVKEPVKQSTAKNSVRLPCIIDFKQTEVIVITGDIREEKTDVIVNTASKDLDLSQGFVSKGLLHRAGSTIQKQCKKKYKHGINYGEVAVTSGGNMSCKKIYHVACPPWRDLSSETNLRNIVSTCLAQASKDKMKSVAFPVLGTGVLKYPRDLVAQSMLEEIREFSESNQTSYPEKVRIVIYDTPATQAFVDFMEINYDNLWPSFVQPPVDADVLPHEDEKEQLISLQIHGHHETNVKWAYQEFLRHYSMESTRKQVDDEDTKAKLRTCSDKQLDELHQLGRVQFVDLIIDMEEEGMECLVIEGCESDVISMEMTIDEFFQNISKDHVYSTLRLVNRGQLYTLHSLSEDSEEYSMITNSLRNTGGPKNIIKIEKLDNPSLMTQYLAKQSEVNTTNGGDHLDNEQILYHGTSVDSLERINSKGFNRSLCDNYGTVYGQGVYFTHDPSISSMKKYTPPDHNGHRYLYQCRVITGRYTQGSEGMKMPPLIGENTQIRYDSTVDNKKHPKIFVVYHDAQAYPQYLITFQQPFGFI